jgi:glycosyltransferase involved in cell wall biosynthesis
MTSPTIDILVPVWNNPFETRACLAAILAHSPDVRLIVVDNAGSREMELMLEEFSEPLGENGLFIKSERNIGFVAAINVGLSRSDSDYTVIVSPHVIVKPGWLDVLLSVAESTGAGIVSPQFDGAGSPGLPHLVPGCSVMESCTISFAALLLRTEMRMVAGVFDDTLDGDEWCLKEYVRRVTSHGYRTCLTGDLRLSCSVGQRFGSALRRSEMLQNSRSAYVSRWGQLHHYGVYFGPETAAGTLGDKVAAIVEGARFGHRFTLLLHRRQYTDFRKMGWNGLHTGVELQQISLLFPQRDLHRKIAALREAVPELIAVRGSRGITFPGDEAAVSFEELSGSMCSTSITNAGFPLEASP